MTDGSRGSDLTTNPFFLTGICGFLIPLSSNVLEHPFIKVILDVWPLLVKAFEYEGRMHTIKFGPA
jgi:hypothetical protein